MDISGTRKAAILLMGLDPATAGELLKSARPEVITEIAAELASLSAPGSEPASESAESIQEFFSLLDSGRKDRSEGGVFVREVLQNALGGEKLQEALGRIEELSEIRDPFRKIRPKPPEEIAKALKGESPQVVSLILSELPPKKSSKLLTLLDENARADALHGIVSGGHTAPETALRIANVIRTRLDELAEQRSAQQAGQVATQPVEDEGESEDLKNKRLRKVALLVRGLDIQPRDTLIAALTEKDSAISESVQYLMVIWEDIPIVADRSLQEILRGSDAAALALALADADQQIVAKVHANISERALVGLEEEASFLSSPKPEEIAEAREKVLANLREANAKGELEFEES